MHDERLRNAKPKIDTGLPAGQLFDAAATVCGVEPLFEKIGDGGIWVGEEMIPLPHPCNALNDMVCGVEGFGSRGNSCPPWAENQVFN